jgi:hypothetical protein
VELPPPKPLYLSASFRRKFRFRSPSHYPEKLIYPETSPACIPLYYIIRITGSHPFRHASMAIMRAICSAIGGMNH